MALTLAQHLKSMTKPGLVSLSQALGSLECPPANCLKDEHVVHIIDRIAAQPLTTTRTTQHEHTNTSTPSSALRAEVAAKMRQRILAEMGQQATLQATQQA